MAIEIAGQSKEGLSPRVRGNQRTGGNRGAIGGPIPASAGEPVTGIGGIEGVKAYPRECGGTSTMLRRLVEPVGLSPRVRGNLCCLRNGEENPGPIPASAGEPTSAPGYNFPEWAYPRECGGTDKVQQLNLLPLGLSPRVRGNLL